MRLCFLVHSCSNSKIYQSVQDIEKFDVNNNSTCKKQKYNLSDAPNMKIYPHTPTHAHTHLYAHDLAVRHHLPPTVLATATATAAASAIACTTTESTSGRQLPATTAADGRSAEPTAAATAATGGSDGRDNSGGDGWSAGAGVPR